MRALRLTALHPWSKLTRWLDTFPKSRRALPPCQGHPMWLWIDMRVLFTVRTPSSRLSEFSSGDIRDIGSTALACKIQGFKGELHKISSEWRGKFSLRSNLTFESLCQISKRSLEFYRFAQEFGCGDSVAKLHCDMSDVEGAHMVALAFVSPENINEC
ncbi:unnamed protein product [Cochlearia groenlandica]